MCDVKQILAYVHYNPGLAESETESDRDRHRQTEADKDVRILHWFVIIDSRRIYNERITTSAVFKLIFVIDDLAL